MALCSDCTSKIEYLGDSATSKFTFPFEYMESTDVKVAQYDETTKEYTELISGTDWTFDNSTTIEITPAPDYTFVIYRCTDIDPLKAEFFPGHPVKAEDLNKNFQQLQMAVGDARCSIETLNNDAQTKGKTITCDEDWVSDDEHLASTCALDKRFWDKADETITSRDSYVYSDDYVVTAKTAEDRFWNKTDETTKISDGWVDGTYEHAGDDKRVPTTGAVEQRISGLIDQTSLVTGIEQRSELWSTSDLEVPTTAAVVERHDTWYSDSNLEPNTYIQPGKFWINTTSQRLSYWNDQGYWIEVASTPAIDGPPVIVSDTEPTESREGDLWWNNTDGTLYVRYCPDPSGSCQWVDASPTVPGGPDGPAVTKILAGQNVTISPTSGLGEVTINAAGSSGIPGINTTDPLTQFTEVNGNITLGIDLSLLANV